MEVSVVIPYAEYEKLLRAASALPDVQNELCRLDQKVTALHGLYSEVLNKLNEVYKLL